MLTVKNVYKWLCLVILLCTGLFSIARQPDFIHIQSEENQPFTVQLNGASYFSSPTGYLVIPQVPAGEHTLVISFPGNEFPPYAFACTMTDNPRGFSLRQSVDNSYSLFDMVSFVVTRGAVATPGQLLAAAGQPVMEKPPVESAKTGADGAISKEPARSAPGVLKIFDKPSASGIDQVYVVMNGTKADTVALFIPVLEEKPKQTAAIPPQGGQGGGENTARVVFMLAPRQTLSSK